MKNFSTRKELQAIDKHNKLTKLINYLNSCFDWNNIDNSEDVSACITSKKIFKISPNAKSKKLVKLTERFKDLPSMSKPNDDVLLLLAKIEQCIQSF